MILAFEHPPPLIEYQVVKGTVEPDEPLDKAALRELYEESGLIGSIVDAKIGTLKLEIRGGHFKELELEKQLWHIYEVELHDGSKETWQHRVTGEGSDEGMIYSFFWHDLNGDHQHFAKEFVELFNFLNNNRLVGSNNLQV